MRLSILFAMHAALSPSRIVELGLSVGFQQVGISDIDLSEAEARLHEWLALGYHGEMAWMAAHGDKRSRPASLIASTQSVISVRMDYQTEADDLAWAQLADPTLAFISRYALGRDYHKVLRQRLQKLVDLLAAEAGPFGYRVFTDSAPVLEKPLAQKAGLGWIGKHTNLINSRAGSWFFLGEIYTDLPLQADQPATDHCGSCSRCIEICPTQAIIAPYVLDARRCISYLTIELDGAIPLEFRRAIGNRIYGCDDCQLVCPWNKFARRTQEPDFLPRQVLDGASLLTLFAWSESEFLNHTLGSAIRRIGHARWLRNIATALGNAPYSEAVVAALKSRSEHPAEMVREHVRWALEQQAAAQAVAA